MAEASPFDIAKNNRGNDEIGIYLSYKRFDEHLYHAQILERERIIDLLISTYPDWEYRHWDDIGPEDIADVIALIKGDNNA